MSTPVIPKRKTRGQRLKSALIYATGLGALASTMCVGLWYYVGMFTMVPFANIVFLALFMFAVGFFMMFVISFSNTGETIEEYTYRRRLNAARNYFVNKEQVEEDVKALGAATEELMAELGKENVKDWMIVERAIDNARVK